MPAVQTHNKAIGVRKQSSVKGTHCNSSDSSLTDPFPDEESDRRRVAHRKTGRASSTTKPAPQDVLKKGSSRSARPSIPRTQRTIINGQELVPTIAFDTFWRFAVERKALDDRRRSGSSPPWTNDPILRDHKFCNTYRVLDKVTQYIIQEVIEKGEQSPDEVIFRVVLFNTFTKIETWELLDKEIGPLSWATYDRETYVRVLDKARLEGRALYTASFQKPAPQFGYKFAFINHLELLEMLVQDLFAVLTNAEYLVDVFEWIAAFPGMGDFTSYQLLLNLSYSKLINFSEADFVIAGLGAHSGLAKMFGKSMARASKASPGIEVDVMRWLQRNQDLEFARLGLKFSGLGPKSLPMELCDIEHCLCEYDKYCRVAHPNIVGLHGRTHIRGKGSTFKPSTTYRNEYVLPDAWSNPARRVVRIRPGGPPRVEKRYVVQNILDHRIDKGGDREYLVSWWGYEAKHNTWEPEEGLMMDAPETVKEYLQKEKRSIARFANDEEI